MTNPDNESRGLALSFARRAVDPSRHLPANILNVPGAYHLFMETGFVFRPSFVNILNEVMLVDGSDTCCILRLGDPFEAEEIVFLDRMTDGEDFITKISPDPAIMSWLIPEGRFVFSPATHKWILYCEKVNDIAVIAVANSESAARIYQIFIRCGAYNMDDLNVAAEKAPLPFGALTRAWRRGLTENFNSSRPVGLG